jgi:hypothetical protein
VFALMSAWAGSAAQAASASAARSR